MPAQLAHIAIDADDVDRAMAFYKNVLGWDFQPWGPPNFYHIKGAGIHGALQERQERVPDGRKGIECTFAVSELESAMSRVREHGGKIISSPFEIESVGTLVKIEDTERNQLILMQFRKPYAEEIGLEVGRLG